VTAQLEPRMEFPVSSSLNDPRSCNLRVGAFPSPLSLSLSLSRAIAAEWSEFIDRSYVASLATEKTRGSLVERSESLLYESAASAESRLDKQGCQTDVSCRPFFGPLDRRRRREKERPRVGGEEEGESDRYSIRKPCRSFAFRYSKLVQRRSSRSIVPAKKMQR